MSRKSFILYSDTYEALKDLTQEEKGDLLDAIYLHAMGEEVKPMKGEAAMAWKFIRIALDRNDEKWEVIRQKRSEAGKLGGAPKGNKNASKHLQEQAKQTNVCFDKQKQAKQAKQAVNVNVNVNDNVNVNVNDNVNVEEEVSSIPSAPATYEERLKSEAVMLQAIANSAATTPQAVIAMLPDFADQLAIDGKKHKNYAEWRKHLQNYILKRLNKQRNNGNTDNNKPFKPAGGIDYSRTDF